LGDIKKGGKSGAEPLLGNAERVVKTSIGANRGRWPWAHVPVLPLSLPRWSCRGKDPKGTVRVAVKYAEPRRFLVNVWGARKGHVGFQIPGDWSTFRMPGGREKAVGDT